MGEWIDDEFVLGYLDGLKPDCMEPGPNQSEAYRHSFNVGRAELADKPIPAQVSRVAAAAIRARLKGDM